MDSENANVIITVLTSTVIAAFLTSTVNIIINLINNWKLKKIENDKHKNELNSYRYTQLFSILLKWNEYDSPYEIKGKSASEITTDRIINGFFDDRQRLKMIKPLLGSTYKKRLEKFKENGDKLWFQLIDSESHKGKISDRKYLESHQIIFEKFKKNAIDFSNELNVVINEQLEVLLEKDN